MSELSQDTWVIEPRSAGVVARAQEVFRYRRMFVFFGQRAIQKLYRRTVLGRAWIVLRPIIPLLVRVFLFGGLLSLGRGVTHVPYFLFVAVGSMAWELFASAVMWATRSLELAGGLVTRLYVPRIILPLATMAPAAVYFAVHVAVVAGALVYYRINDGIWYLDTTWLVVAPVSLVLIVALAFGIGLFTSVLGAQARDVRFGLGYVLEFWVYLTPVVYPLSQIPNDLSWAVTLNPMSVLVVAFRGALLGGEGPEPWAWVVAIATVATILAAGLVYFYQVEAEAIDSL